MTKEQYSYCNNIWREAAMAKPEKKIMIVDRRVFRVKKKWTEQGSETMDSGRCEILLWQNDCENRLSPHKHEKTWTAAQGLPAGQG